MNKLEKIRESAGIVFKKSFGCIDAEKNIHLLDKDQFFAKIIERLHKMGYETSNDFDFDVVRHKFAYAERHHIGKTYEWKYFYSTTFEIDQDLINYLTYHRYIQTKDSIASKPKVEKHTPMSWEEVITKNEHKIKKYKQMIEDFKARGNLISIKNYEKAIQNCEEKIKNVKELIAEKEENK